MSDNALFEPEEVPPGLDGVDAELLADLHDVAAKYGVEVAGVEGLRKLRLDGPKTMHVSVTVPPSRQRNIFISPWSGGASMTASHAFMIKDGVHSFVLWDKSFTVADVRLAIDAVDKVMDATRDPLTRARCRVIADRKASPKYRVDEVFAKRGRAVSSFHGEGPEETRAQFDRPEDVAVMTAADGRKFLCHRRDAHGFDPARQQEAILRAVARRGLRDEADLRALSKEELRKMYEEINAELFGDGD